MVKGKSPLSAALKKAQKAAGKERAANSFETIAHEWLDERVERVYETIFSLDKLVQFFFNFSRNAQ